jgi:hypothetical protein
VERGGSGYGSTRTRLEAIFGIGRIWCRDRRWGYQFWTPSGAVHFLFYFTSDRRRTGVKHFSLYRVNRDMPGVRLKLVCNARRKVKDVRRAGLASLSRRVSFVAFCSNVFTTGQELWDPQVDT